MSSRKKHEMRLKPTGRKSMYSNELADKICDLIVQGYTLRQIAALEGMPSTVTMLAWLNPKTDKHKEKYGRFLIQYKEAKRIQAEAMVEELLEIADDGTNDWVKREGGTVQNPEAVGRSRLRVDTRKWYISKVLPKVYGDKLNIGGQHGENPIEVDMSVKVEFVNVEKKED